MLVLDDVGFSNRNAIPTERWIGKLRTGASLLLHPGHQSRLHNALSVGGAVASVFLQVYVPSWGLCKLLARRISEGTSRL